MVLKGLFSNFWLCLVMVLVAKAKDLELPGSCQPGQYYEPNVLGCEACPVNGSMTTSADGFGCTCMEHSVPITVGRCKPCNITEVVSSDGRSCVPRRCQTSAGRAVCRKCPADYITVTRSLDGSPLKEVQCVKCGRGYRPHDNICVRCESCACNKNQIVVRGICIPKSYVNTRPKYEDNNLHPIVMLDIVKHEYLCMQNDVRACRRLAHECVKHFYSIDPAGPCRLWIQSNVATPKGLPQLTVQSSLDDKHPGEINLAQGNNVILLAGAIYTSVGEFQFYKDADQNTLPCFLPLYVTIGRDFTRRCSVSSLKLDNYLNVTISPYLYNNRHLIQIPVYPTKPNGYNIQRGTWLSSKFKRYFIVDSVLSTVTNTTNTVFLKTITIRLQIERDKSTQGSLRVRIGFEVVYATKPSLSDSIEMTLSVTHEMPEAGVHRGIEVWCGVLGSLLILYTIVQWRGTVRRGGVYFSVIPFLSSAIADTVYFASWFATLHALAAEAGTLGMTLPLSHREERIIKILVYTAISLKTVKVAWLNINQCRNDVFFLDWSEYNPPFIGELKTDKCNNWRAAMLAREWSGVQTARRVSPGHTVTITLLLLHIMSPWQSYLPQSQGYTWAVATIAWWSSYTTLLVTRWATSRFIDSPVRRLPKTCAMAGMSLIVFEEEYYAHYVHGRNDESKDLRAMAGPLAMCRIVCASQLRIIYKQLALSIPELGETESRQALLSRFLAAFFERALDGLSWVASERTTLERLLDVELTTREAGNTSTLLYDANDTTPSCLNVTWWGEELSLATFDAMLFSCVLMATNNVLLAALVAVIVWQVHLRESLHLLTQDQLKPIMAETRRWFGLKNQIQKTEVRI